MGVRETGWEGVDWMHLAQDRDQWQALMNTVMTDYIHLERVCTSLYFVKSG
jgi:hypothetical protein